MKSDVTRRTLDEALTLWAEPVLSPAVFLTGMVLLAGLLPFSSFSCS